MIKPVTDKFKIYCNSTVEHYRCDTFYDKEPETISWIDGFDDGVFIDVGANIGIYSLYCASIHPNMTIYAIEPMVANYVRLCMNVGLNEFKNIQPIHAAVGYEPKWLSMRTLACTSDKPGTSGHSISDEHQGQPVIYTNLSALFSEADYLKIDTDGNETDVLRGAKRVLPKLKSLLVEARTDTQDAIDHKLQFKGFRLDKELWDLPNHSRYRREKEANNDAVNLIYRNLML
ncbi:MAG: FkbM family methyltransferase [Candidatus Omnitrophica bacterium]|nr:FkbM family methyltransferase [Candidatus Omnitrophota bacterium]